MLNVHIFSLFVLTILVYAIYCYTFAIKSMTIWKQQLKN